MNVRTTVQVKVDKAKRMRIDTAFAQGLHALATAVGERADSRIKKVTGRTAGTRTVLLYLRGKEAERKGELASGDAAQGGQIVALVGYDFIGRLLETGTSDTSAQPFLGPSTDEVVATGKPLLERTTGEAMGRG